LSHNYYDSFANCCHNELSENYIYTIKFNQTIITEKAVGQP
jgi:hypothetical protein